MLWLLLKNKLNMFLNGFLKGDLSRRRRRLFALIGGMVLFYFLFQWAYEIFHAIYVTRSDGILLLSNILALFFFGFFIFLLASGVMIAIHYLFVSSDLQLLLSAPISSSTIFSYKLIESIFANSSFFFFLGVPAFISLGIVVKAPFFYYPLMIVNALIFLTIPISISFLIALLIVRIIPAARAKEITAALLGIVSLVIWLSIQMFRASHFDSHSNDFNPERIQQLKLLIQKPVFNLLPSTWAAKSLVAFCSLNWTSILADFVPLLLTAGLIFMICLTLIKSAFNKGLIVSQFDIAIKKKKNKVEKENRLMISQRAIFSSVIGTIFIREFKLVFRDIRLLTSTLMLVVMMIIFPLLRGSDDISSQFGEYLPFIFILFFSAFVSIQLTSRLIPYEGKSFWVTMLLPQSWRKILIGKLLVGFLFNLISIWLAVSVSCIYFRVSIRMAVLAFMITSFVSFVISVFGLSIGSLFSKFDWDHPKRMVSSGGSFILSLGSLLIVGLWMLFITLIYKISSLFNYNTFISDLIVIIFSLIIVIFSMIVGFNLSIKKLKNLEWNF